MSSSVSPIAHQGIKQMTSASQCSFLIRWIPLMTSASCVLCLFPPCDSLFFDFPQACEGIFKSSFFCLRCIYGKCQGVTIEQRGSVSTKLLRMFLLLVLRGAACCYRILRLVQLILIMDGFKWFVVKKLCPVSLQSNFFLFIMKRLQVPNTKKGLVYLFLSSSIEPDLWDHTDTWPGIWGGLSAGSAGPEDQAAPEPPSGTHLRDRRDQVQSTRTQTTRQRTEIIGELEEVLEDRTSSTAHTAL